MSQCVQEVGLYVRDQDEGTLAFYVGKLGFRVHTGCAERRLSLAHGAAPGPAFIAARPFQAGSAGARRGHRADSARDRRQRGDAAPRAGRGGLPRRLRAHARRRRRVHAGAHEPLRQGGRRFPRPLRQWVEDDRVAPLSTPARAGLSLRLQKNPVRRPVRDQQQRHDESRDEVGRPQLARREPCTVGLIERVQYQIGRPQRLKIQAITMPGCAAALPA